MELENKSQLFLLGMMFVTLIFMIYVFFIMDDSRGFNFCERMGQEVY